MDVDPVWRARLWYLHLGQCHMASCFIQLNKNFGVNFTVNGFKLKVSLMLRS